MKQVYWAVLGLGIAGIGIALGAQYAASNQQYLVFSDQKARTPHIATAPDAVAYGAGHEVVMTPQGYLPLTITIRQGEQVLFSNKGESDQWPIVVPNKYPAGVVPAGRSWAYTFSEKGEYTVTDKVYPHVGVRVLVN